MRKIFWFLLISISLVTLISCAPTTTSSTSSVSTSTSSTSVASTSTSSTSVASTSSSSSSAITLASFTGKWKVTSISPSDIFLMTNGLNLSGMSNAEWFTSLNRYVTFESTNIKFEITGNLVINYIAYSNTTSNITIIVRYEGYNILNSSLDSTFSINGTNIIVENKSKIDSVIVSNITRNISNNVEVTNILEITTNGSFFTNEIGGTAGFKFEGGNKLYIYGLEHLTSGGKVKVDYILEKQ